MNKRIKMERWNWMKTQSLEDTRPSGDMQFEDCRAPADHSIRDTMPMNLSFYARSQAHPVRVPQLMDEVAG